ncbi:MAG: tRNA (pseudouridine(54)-N(1))-methyltransferase TrmY [Candidatus Aenigmarchaeota archaeon]|nr:tRNA (pseudouridine(54)-N(1))-methyltransferase TrmY [Candidatus Aenigmarchaeota archaeon]
MRIFIIYARKARTDNKFLLKDLAGSGGKMDTVCRFVTSCLWVSHGLRRDVDIYLVLNGPPRPPITIHISGENVKRMDPNERSIAIWIQKSLKGEITKDWKNIQEGIKVSAKSFQEIIKSLSDRPMYVLEEKGEYIEDIEIKENPVFVIGDHLGMPRNEEKFVLRYGEKISLGKQPYFASTCATILNWILDKRKL